MKVNRERIREIRLARGWTQEQLASFSEVAVRTIQRLEEEGSAGLETLKSIAATLEVDIAQLSLHSQLKPSFVEQNPEEFLGRFGPLLAAISDALNETNHWRQHFNDLFMFRTFFMRKPDPPLCRALELQAHLAAEVSLRIHEDVKKGISQLERLDVEVQSLGSHIRSLAAERFHVSPEVQHEATVAGNELCDHVEFYLGRAQKELIKRIQPVVGE